jgi:hypothetical protein
VRDVEQAIKIDRHDVLPILDHGVRLSGKGVAPVDAGIVDQDRDLADFARHFRRDVAARQPVGDVEREGLRPATVGVDVGYGLGRGLAVDIEDGKRRALARETERNGATDPRARAGDDRDVIAQKPRHRRPPLCLTPASRDRAGGDAPSPWADMRRRYR